MSPRAHGASSFVSFCGLLWLKNLADLRYLWQRPPIGSATTVIRGAASLPHSSRSAYPRLIVIAKIAISAGFTPGIDAA